MTERFKKIEKEYNVEEIICNDENIWAYLRVSYYWETMQDKIEEYAKKNKTSLYKKIIRLSRQAFYGFKNWFRRYDYFVFSDTSERYQVGNFYIDKSTGKIIELLGQNRCLFIETPNPDHLYKKNIDTHHVVSKSAISIIIFLANFLINKFKFKRVNSIDILEDINDKELLKLDYKKEIIRFNISKAIYKVLFKFYKPKAIIINCYYGNQYIIKAANELNIKTVEVQHGIIESIHFAYNPHKKLDKSYFPKILLTYSERDKNILLSNNYNTFEHIFAVGNYFLEYLKNLDLPKQLLNMTKNYTLTISISTQYPVENELAKFIKMLANQYPDIGFFFSLRHFEKDYYKQFSLPSNVHLFKGEYSCYDILKSSDIHLTVYSTCALEATYFNKKVILVNVNNMSKKYMSEIEANNFYIIDNLKDFDFALKEKYSEEQFDIFYKKNYHEHIASFIENELI